MPTKVTTRSRTSAEPLRSNSSPTSLDLVAPRYLSIPDYDVTLGPEVAAVATLAGFPPDPEQRLLLDAAFAVDRRSGKSVAFEIVVIAPRQNLKTGFEKQYALGQLYVRDERLSVWSAHEFDTAQEALKDMESLIEGSADLTQMTRRVTRGSVPEIETMTGARLKFKTRTSGGGRGLSGRKVILDEGYALQPGQVGALMPIMLAQPDPQVVIGSSACRPESATLWDIIVRGRAGGDPRMVYAEWCTPEPEVACDQAEKCDHSRGARGCGCDKPELIEAAHSAIRRGRILLATVIDLRKTMPPDEYGREVMGWHDETVTGGAPPIDVDKWTQLEDPNAAADEVVAFGVEISVDRVSSSIGAAGPMCCCVPPLPPCEPLVHLEHIEHQRGTEWVLDRCIALDKAHGPALFAVDADGPAAALVPAMETAGLTVALMSTADVGTASAGLVDAVNNSTVTHGPQPELDDAVRAARKRLLGDGRFTFGRKASNLDIAPLVSVRNAHWAATNRPRVDVLNSIW